MERISPTPRPPPSLRKMQDGEIYLCSFADHGRRGGTELSTDLAEKSLCLVNTPKKTHNKKKKRILKMQEKKEGY